MKKGKRVSEVGGRVITIALDHLPPSELSPNARLCWYEKSQWVQVARDEVGWLAKSQWHDDVPMVKARISWEFHLPDHRKRDLDNLLASCKSFSDGLIDAGVITYDDATHLEIGSVKAVYADLPATIIKVLEIL